MTLIDKILRQSLQRIHPDDGQTYVIFQCEYHGQLTDPFKPLNNRCEECWTIVFIAQECLRDDIAEGTASLHKFHETAHKIAETARRDGWDYRPSKPVVRIDDNQPLIELTD